MSWAKKIPSLQATYNDTDNEDDTWDTEMFPNSQNRGPQGQLLEKWRQKLLQYKIWWFYSNFRECFYWKKYERLNQR